jgi:hypothetical protein
MWYKFIFNLFFMSIQILFEIKHLRWIFPHLRRLTLIHTSQTPNSLISHLKHWKASLNVHIWVKIFGNLLYFEEINLKERYLNRNFTSWFVNFKRWSFHQVQHKSPVFQNFNWDYKTLTPRCYIVTHKKCESLIWNNGCISLKFSKSKAYDLRF